MSEVAKWYFDTSINITVTPININQTYLDISKILGMSALRQNMTLTQFRSATKLNLVKNLE